MKADEAKATQKVGGRKGKRKEKERRTSINEWNDPRGELGIKKILYEVSVPEEARVSVSPTQRVNLVLLFEEVSTL